VTLLVAAAIVLLALTTLFSALNLALVQASESAVAERFEEHGRAATNQWIFDRWKQVDDAVSFLRTWGRIGFFAIVLWAGTRQPDGTIHADHWQIAQALLASALLLWLFTSVVSGAIARYAAVGLITSCMPMLRVSDFLLRPLTTVGRGVDEAVKRLTGANTRGSRSERELLQSIEDTRRQGGIDPVSARMIENVVEFTDTVVAEVMTPRTEIEGLEYTDDLAVIRGMIHREGHSRIPVYEGSLDRIVGVLYVKDLAPQLGMHRNDFVLRPLLRQPIRVPETKKVRDLLLEFQRSKLHMAIVIDEFGGTAGLLTIEDVLEEIVGEIRDEHEGIDDDSPHMVEVSRTIVEVEGRYPWEALAAHFDIPVADDVPYTTVAGFVLTHFGRVPAAGEAFEDAGLRVSVLEANATTVQKLSVERLPERDEKPETAT